MVGAYLQVQQAAVAALAELHRAGVLHGDIFPANFMVEERPGQAPRVTVVDLERSQFSEDQEAFVREMEDLKAMLGWAPSQES